MPTKLQVKLLATYEGHRQSVYIVVDDFQGGFFSAGSEGMVVQWNPEDPTNGKLFARLPEAIFSLHFLKNEGILLAGGQSGTLYYLKQGQPTIQLKAHEKAIFAIAGESTELIYTAGGDGKVLAIDYYRRVLFCNQLNNENVRFICPAFDSIWVGGSDGNIWQLNVALETLETLKAHGNSVMTMDVDFERKHWVSAGRDAKIKVWNMDNLKELKSLDAHWYTVHQVKFSPTKTVLASASMDKTIRLWSAKDFKLLKVIDTTKFDAHKSSVNGLFWISDTQLISCSDDASLKCWEILS